MSEHTKSSAEFWNDLERNVTAKVDAALSEKGRSTGPLVSYLRDLETMARAECGFRQTVQIIASGRRLLGDRSQISPNRGPLAHAAGWRNTFPLRQTGAP